MKVLLQGALINGLYQLDLSSVDSQLLHKSSKLFALFVSSSHPSNFESASNKIVNSMPCAFVESDIKNIHKSGIFSKEPYVSASVNNVNAIKPCDPLPVNNLTELHLWHNKLVNPSFAVLKQGPSPIPSNLGFRYYVVQHTHDIGGTSTQSQAGEGVGLNQKAVGTMLLSLALQESNTDTDAPKYDNSSKQMYGGYRLSMVIITSQLS
ncbi:hypothetical protein ACOSP7_028542 [Xanthoceras sorbifolium]